MSNSSDSDSDYEGSAVSYVLHNAAESGDAEALERMLGLSEAGSVALAQIVFYRRLLNLQDRNECTPLHLAIINGHPSCVSVLLRGGASASRGCDGSPPLALAACLGLSAAEGRAAAAEGCVAALLEAGADPHDRDDGGRTALHWAACCRRPALLPPLLRAAAACHRTRLAALMEAGEGAGGLPALERPEHILSMTDHDGFNPLHYAAKFGHPEVVSELLRAAAESAAAAAAAAEELAKEAAEAAAAEAADVDMEAAAAAEPPAGGAEGAAAAAAAATTTATAAPPSAASLAALLPVCEAAALVRARSRHEGHTPLHLAAAYGRAAAAEALLAGAGRLHGKSGLAKVLAVADKKGCTAADVARRRGHAALADALKEAASGKPFKLPLESAAPSSASDPATAPSMSESAAPPASTSAPPPSTSMMSPPPPPASSSASCPGRTLLLAPEACLLHRTAPEPLGRSGPEPPPENVTRLHVLTQPVTGILHNEEFSSLEWRTRGIPNAAMVDVLKCHEWSYVRDVIKACDALPDSPSAVGSLDPDTAISRHSLQAALAAAGAVCAAVDEVVAGRARNAFCAVRPPGHHAGPSGAVTNPNDPRGSHGFCLLSNVAIGAAYAVAMHRHAGIRRVAILDFDVHHGNGTQACVLNTAPSVRVAPLTTPFSEGVQRFPVYKPWLGDGDVHNIFFASVQGYGIRGGGGGGWFYPGSGATADSAIAAALKPRPSVVPPPPASAAAGGDDDTAAADPAANAESAAAAGGADAAASDGAAVVAAAADAGGSGGGFPPIPEDPEGEFRGGYDVTVTGGPRVINVGIPGPGSKPRMWRKAWRDKILPALVNFRPDIILLSAGFDAHKKEDLNLRYVGVTEADYEWLTGQLVEVANACCGGRLVSVLEGGYNLRGGPLGSAFARSVAAHVRALAAPTTARYEPSWAEMERAAERAAEKAAEAKRAAKAAERAAALAAGLSPTGPASPGSLQPTPRGGPPPAATPAATTPAAATPATTGGAAATPAATAAAAGDGLAPMDTNATPPAPTPTPAGTAAAAAAGTATADGAVTPAGVAAATTTAAAATDVVGSGGGVGSGEEPPSKRRRRPPVDYAALNAQLEKERLEAEAAGTREAAGGGGAGQA